MNIIISPTLNKLAEIFNASGASLYIVGGYVRNAILGFYDTDIDLCSSLTPDQVKKVLKDTGFVAMVVNKKLGTLLIKSKFTPETYEYTPFRSENYPEGGHHSPSDVKFILDLSEDARRRDFTANSIYYDIKYGVVVDNYNGQADVKAKLLRCIEKPEFVFKSDGLRILRLVRMGAELGFTLEEQTFKIAKSLAGQLKDISRERFNKEVLGMLYADFRYTGLSKPKAHVHAMQNLTDLFAWGYVLPELLKYDIKTAKENPEQILLPQNWYSTLAEAEPELRLAALVYDISTALSLSVNYQLIDDILGQKGLMVKKEEIKATTDLLRASRKAKTGFASHRDESIFIMHHHNFITKLIAWQKLRGITSNLSVRYDYMIIEKIPMTLKELKINGNDLKAAFPYMKPQQYAFHLNMALEAAVAGKTPNKKSQLLQYLKENGL